MTHEMTPLLETMYKRRSIRAYKDQPVEKEKIDIILKAAMSGPSACNLQPWEFVVITEPEAMAHIREASMLNKDLNVPLVIVVCGTTKHLTWGGTTWMQDCGAAAQNILLAATELGLGSLWTGGFDAEKLKSLLNMPEYVQPMAVIYIGYADTERKALTWYDEAAVHWQKFDKDRERTYRTMEMLKADVESGLL